MKTYRFRKFEKENVVFEAVVNTNHEYQILKDTTAFFGHTFLHVVQGEYSQRVFDVELYAKWINDGKPEASNTERQRIFEELEALAFNPYSQEYQEKRKELNRTPNRMYIKEIKIIDSDDAIQNLTDFVAFDKAIFGGIYSFEKVTAESVTDMYNQYAAKYCPHSEGGCDVTSN